MYFIILLQGFLGTAEEAAIDERGQRLLIDGVHRLDERQVDQLDVRDSVVIPSHQIPRRPRTRLRKHVLAVPVARVYPEEVRRPEVVLLGGGMQQGELRVHEDVVLG